MECILDNMRMKMNEHIDRVDRLMNKYISEQPSIREEIVGVGNYNKILIDRELLINKNCSKEKLNQMVCDFEDDIKSIIMHKKEMHHE